MSINWPTTIQGPKKKSIQFTKRRIDPYPAHTARNKGSFTTMVLWTVNPLFPQLYIRLKTVFFAIIFIRKGVSPRDAIFACTVVKNLKEPLARKWSTYQT